MPNAPSQHARPPHAARAAALPIILVAAMTACGDGPTRPPDLVDASEATIVATTDAVDDAGDRIAMQLDQASGGGTLYARLNELASRIGTREKRAIADALERSRTALDAADASGPAAEAPDRAAIRVALDQVQAQLLSID
jgi:hypothetical protein